MNTVTCVSYLRLRCNGKPHNGAGGPDGRGHLHPMNRQRRRIPAACTHTSATHTHPPCLRSEKDDFTHFFQLFKIKAAIGWNDKFVRSIMWQLMTFENWYRWSEWVIDPFSYSIHHPHTIRWSAHDHLMLFIHPFVVVYVCWWIRQTMFSACDNEKHLESLIVDISKHSDWYITVCEFCRTDVHTHTKPINDVFWVQTNSYLNERERQILIWTSWMCSVNSLTPEQINST